MNKGKIITGVYSIHLLPMICCMLLLPVVLLTACRKKTVYTYDLEPLEAVKPEMICYKEVTRVPLDFNQCLGMAAWKSRIYVSGDNRLSAFDPDGTLLWSRELPGQARCLTGGNGVLYLGMIDYVAVYDPEGNELSTWASLGERAIITSLAAAGSLVYAADAGNHVVMCYNDSGKLEKILEGADDTGFIIPSPYFDLAAGAGTAGAGTEDSVWVVNPGRHRLEHFNRDGTFLSAWGRSGFGLKDFSGCCNPIHMALLPGGGFVTAEKGIPRIKVYNTAGEFQCVAAEPAQFKTNTVAADLAVMTNGDILLLDPGVSAVRIFSRNAEGQE